jgi:hypothetical protein
LAANFGQKILRQDNFGLNIGVKNCDMGFLHFIFAQVSTSTTVFVQKQVL